MTPEEIQADIKALGNALREADASGDTEKATKYARAYKKAKTQLTMASDPAELDPSSEAFQERYGPTGGFLKNFDVGVGKALTDMGLGIKQLASFRNPGRRAELEQEAQRKRQIDAPLIGTAGGKLGAVTGGIAATLPILAIPGLNTIPGAIGTGAAFGAVQPATGTGERAINTGIGGAMGGVGQVLGGKLANFAGKRLADRAVKNEASRVARQPINELVARARAEGLVIPPTTANPSGLNKALEGFSGKLSTGQGASVLNQRKFNNLAKRSIGIPDDVPLTDTAIKAVRQKAGRVYRDIANEADVFADQKFIDDLINLPREMDELRADFPDLKLKGADEVRELADGLFRDKFSSKSALEVVKRLRKDSTTNFKSFDDPAKRSLAFAQRKAADAVDDLLVRNMRQQGSDQLASQYDQARRLIAKTHSVESALNKAGNISGRKLAQQLNKGKPLSGELDLIAQFSDAFPKAARPTTESFPGISPLDVGFSGIVGGGALAAGSPGAGVIAALPIFRALARRGMLSGPAQNAMLTPAANPGMFGRGALNLLGTAGRVAPAAGIAGSPFIRPEEEEAF